MLAADGVECALAGVYGEVLGGHYGISMLLQGASKAVAVAKTMLGMEDVRSQTFEAVAGLLSDVHMRSLVKPFYLTDEFWKSLGDPAAEVRAHLEWSLSRLRTRGISCGRRLLEGFIT